MKEGMMMRGSMKMTMREITRVITMRSMKGTMKKGARRVREGKRTIMITITRRKSQKMPSMRKVMITMRTTSMRERMLSMRRKWNTKTRKSKPSIKNPAALLRRLLELKTIV